MPGLRVAVRAAQNYIGHQSANQAGSVAYSSILASFPLLLFLSAAAAFVGKPGAAAALASKVLEFAPPVVAETLKPVVDQVLRQPSQTLLTIGVLVTLWAASSGIQAIRTALNRAYGVTQGRSFWSARIKVMLFTVAGTIGTVLAFGSIIILPYVWIVLHKTIGVGAEAAWLQTGVRYALAFIVLTVLYALMYGWLPDIPQRLGTVLPGAVVGALLWLAAAAILSYTLRSVGKLALVYGGFAGIVATLVFLYASAATLIFGAEINAVLRHGAAKNDAVPESDR